MANPLGSPVEPADYAAVALRKAMEYHDQPVPLDDVRAACGSGDALGMSLAAQSFGFMPHGITVGVEDLETLEPGALLFWDMSHFVVLHSADEDGIMVVDPATGPRRVDWDEARASLHGIALLLRRGGMPEPARPNGSWRRFLPGRRNG